jgi:Tfp pilus assembly protein PilF
MLDKEQIRFIEENSGTYSVKALAKKLNMSSKKLKHELQNLRLSPAQKKERPKTAFVPASINSTNRKGIMALVLIVFIITMAGYVNNLGNGFIWDDEYLILYNSQIKSFSHFSNIFKTYVGYGSGNVNNFYRPVQELSNMIDYFLWREDPMGFHLTNDILHSLAAVMVLFFVFYLTKSLFVSFVSAVLFGIHPINTEAVTYIAGRADSLFFFFFLLSIVCFIRYGNKTILGKGGMWLYVVSLVSFVLSLLSKETSLILPLVILLYLFVILKGQVGQRAFSSLAKSWAGFAVIVVLYAMLRSSALDFARNMGPPVFASVPLFARMFTFFKIILVYFGILIFPQGLHMERRIPISYSPFEPGALVGFIIVAFLVFVAFTTLRKNRIVSFSLFWFFLTLFPVSNIIPINSLLAEHWVYMPQIGLFIVIGMLLKTGAQKYLPSKALKGIGMLALCGIMSLYFMGTVQRNTDWKDEITFFKATLKHQPNNSRLHLNLGNTYFEKGMKEEALEEYQKTIELNKKDPIAYCNIATIYINRGNLAKAEEYLSMALHLDQNVPLAHLNMGIVYRQRGKREEAKREFMKTIEIFPGMYKAHNMLAELFLKEGNTAQAKKYFEASLAVYPNQPDIINRLGRLR